MLIGFKKKVFGKRLIDLKIDPAFDGKEGNFYPFVFSWIMYWS